MTKSVSFVMERRLRGKIVRLFSAAGCPVSFFMTYERARKGFVPDLVVLDVQIGNDSDAGFEYLKLLIEEGTLPLVYTSMSVRDFYQKCIDHQILMAPRMFSPRSLENLSPLIEDESVFKERAYCRFCGNEVHPDLEDKVCRRCAEEAKKGKSSDLCGACHKKTEGTYGPDICEECYGKGIRVKTCKFVDSNGKVCGQRFTGDRDYCVNCSFASIGVSAIFF